MADVASAQISVLADDTDDSDEADDNDPREQAIIAIARGLPEVSERLVGRTNLDSEAWPSEEDAALWEVAFFSDDTGEYVWLMFNPDTKEIIEIEAGVEDVAAFESDDDDVEDEESDADAEAIEAEPAGNMMGNSMDGGNSMQPSMSMTAMDDVETNGDYEFDDDDYEAKMQIGREVAQQDDQLRAILDQNPNWQVEGWPETDLPQGVWAFYFHSENWETHLANALIDVENRQIVETELPRQLSEAEYAQQKSTVEQLLLADPEVEATLGAASNVTIESTYDGFGNLWLVNLYTADLGYTAGVYYGPEEIEVYWLEPADIEELTDGMSPREKAVEIAWNDETLWPKLEDTDNWTTLVSPQGNGIYAVEFVTDNKSLAVVLVDINVEVVMGG